VGIFILRHGEAGKTIPMEGLGAERPLTSEAMREVAGVCKRLDGVGLKFDRIASSSLKRCHRRSLTETAVSTVKRRFRHTLYSKKRRGQKNELRLKVITHNLSIIARMPATLK